MRIRTIRGAYRELKAIDPNSAVGLTMLYRLVADGTIPSSSVSRGKIMIDLDRLEDYLFGKDTEGAGD